MKSIIIQIPQAQNNNILNNLIKIETLANQLKVYSPLEIILILTIHNAFKNNPLHNNRKTQQNLQLDIIQIIQQQAYNQDFIKKQPTISAINNAMWKLTKAGALIEIDGMLVLNSAFKHVDEIEQIVFRFS